MGKSDSQSIYYTLCYSGFTLNANSAMQLIPDWLFKVQDNVGGAWARTRTLGEKKKKKSAMLVYFE